MLSSGELAAYQAEFNNLLGDTCVIQRLTTTSDNQGGSTSSWLPAGTALCIVAPIKKTGGDGAVVGDQVTETADRVITLPASTDVRVADQLVIATKTYQVSEMREPRTYEIVRRVEARLL